MSEKVHTASAATTATLATMASAVITNPRAAPSMPH